MLRARIYATHDEAERAIDEEQSDGRVVVREKRAGGGSGGAIRGR